MWDTARRLLYLRVAIAAGTIAGMALSHKLWLTDRFYPLTPVFPFLKPIPTPYDSILFGAALLSLAASALTPRLIPIFATLAVILAITDQSRLQPWFYEYFFLLLGVAFASPNACRLIVAATYFWTGAQELNAGFINDVFPMVLHLPERAHALVHPLSQAAPFIEILIGIALLSRKFRLGAVIAGVAMHVFILIALNHVVWPWVVWPWNPAMAASVVILFWKTTESPKQILFGEGPFHIAILLLFALAPMLSFFGYWDHYYSSSRGMIFFADKMFDRMPEGIADYARVETPELDSIDLNEWSATELNVPPYPEIRIYKNVARQLCAYTDLRLSITAKSTIGKTITGTSYTCAALK